MYLTCDLVVECFAYHNILLAIVFLVLFLYSCFVSAESVIALAVMLHSKSTPLLLSYIYDEKMQVNY